MASASDLAPALEEFCDYLSNAGDSEIDSNTSVEEILRIVEESSSEMEALKFVELIRESVEAGVSNIIDRRMKSAKRTQNIADRVAKTAEFSKTKSQILKSCAQATESLLMGEKKSSRSAGTTREPQRLNPSSAKSSAWLGQSMGLFVGDSVLDRAIAILRSKGQGNRAVSLSQLEVLNQLAQITSLELGQSAKYPELCESLEDLLRNPMVYSETVNFLAKMFNAPIASVTTLTFVNTTKFLKSWSKDMESGASGKEMSAEDDSYTCYLMLFRLWHQMLMTLCDGWLRYPETLVADAVNAVVDFLSLCALSEIQESYPIGNPVLCLALLDSYAIWFRKWMHGTYSRRKLVSALRKQPAFLRYILRVSLYAEINSDETVATARSRAAYSNSPLYYSRQEKKRALLLYSVRSLSVVLRYTSCQNALFPVELFENSKSVLGAASCLGKLIRRRLNEEDSPIPVTVAARKSVLELSKEGKKSQSIFFEWEVVEQICSALGGKRTRREAKLTAVQLLLNLSKLGQQEEEFFAAYGTFIVEHCSSLVRLASEHDPNALLNLVLGMVELCRCLLHRRESRKLMKQRNLVADLSVLVKERNLIPDVLFPFLASFDLPDDSVKRHRRSLFLSDDLAYLQVPVEIGPTIFDCCVKLINRFMRSCSKGTNPKISQSGNSDSADFLFGGKQFLPLFPPSIFILASQPEMAWACVQNESFAEFIGSFFVQIGQMSAAVAAAGLGILTLLCCNLDFASALEAEKHLSTHIMRSLREHCVRGKDELFISRLSVGLVQLFLNLQIIGGPKERDLRKIITDKFPRSVSALEQGHADFFQLEPSRFLIKKIEVGVKDLPEKKHLMDYFYESLLSRQRPPYAEILIKYSLDSDLEMSRSTRKDLEQDWNTVVEYCESLKLTNDRNKCLKDLRDVASNAPYTAHSSAKGTDWFLTAVTLIMEFDKPQIQKFCGKFAATLQAKTVWPYLVGHEAHSNALIEQAIPFIENVSERLFPRLRAALSLAGLPLMFVVSFWVNQCFLNVLDWSEVCSYVTMSVIGGSRYQLYFLLAVLKHMEDEICESVIYSSFPFVLVAGSTKKFKLHHYVKFIKELNEMI